MAEYTPVFLPGQTITLSASAEVTGGQALIVSGVGTVAPSGGASAAFIGIAGNDTPSGERVTVHRGGVQEFTAAGAITASQAVETASSGRVATLGATPANRVGLALTSAADGALVRVAVDN